MTDKPTQELKPCAHCGSSDVELRESITDAMVACNNCGARSGLVYFGASEAANANELKRLVTAWNTRSGDATELLRECRNYFRDLRRVFPQVANNLLPRIDAHLEGEA